MLENHDARVGDFMVLGWAITSRFLDALLGGPSRVHSVFVSSSLSALCGFLRLSARRREASNGQHAGASWQGGSWALEQGKKLPGQELSFRPLGRGDEDAVQRVARVEETLRASHDDGGWRISQLRSRVEAVGLDGCCGVGVESRFALTSKLERHRVTHTLAFRRHRLLLLLLLR